MLHRQYFPIRPVPWQRTGGNGRSRYKEKRTRDFENAVAMLYRGPTYDGPVAVRIDIHTDGFWLAIHDVENSRPKHCRGDIDNLAKAVLDGLQLDGGAIRNDNKVHQLGIKMGKD